MSHAFVNALKKNPKQSYVQLLNTIRDFLDEGGYSQKPQLSCSHPLGKLESIPSTIRLCRRSNKPGTFSYMVASVNLYANTLTRDRHRDPFRHVMQGNW